MNRKLKNLLKETYGSELPNRKFSFIQQLQNNPTWKKLHPISSVFRGYPAIKPVFAVFATMAVATGIIAYNFSVDKNTPPDTPPVLVPPILTTSAETSVTSTVTTAVTKNTVSSENTSVAVTTDLLNKSTSVKISTATEIVSNEKTATTKSSITETITITQTIVVQTSVQTTETESMSTTATTSVYYTHLFRHDYTVEETYDDTLFYGYPDYNLLEDMFKIISKESNWYKLIGGMTSADFSEAMMKLLLLWDVPNIVEGEITNLEYIAYEGKPWTICEITLSEVYNSNVDKYHPIIMQKGDKVKIAMAGGYMAVSKYIELNPDDTMFTDWTDEQINSTVIYEDGSNQNELKIGDNYLYFINESELDIPVENLYTRQFMCDIAQFIKNDDKYVSCNSNYSDFSVYSERLETLRNHYDLFYDPDSDRCIAFRNESILFFGAFSCYSVDSDGRLALIDYIGTDDGYYPFYDDEYEFSRDELGRPTIIGKAFTMTWTDSGVIIECSNSDFNETVEIKYPKT